MIVQRLFTWVLIATLILAAAVFSLVTGGRTDVGTVEIWKALAGLERDGVLTILKDIRLPRSLAAGLLGMTLGVSGLILQAITLNPLASPAILGINQGAAVGMIGALIWPGIMPPEWLSMAGALFAGLLTFAISGGLAGRLDPMRLVLGGVAVGTFAYAAVRFAFTLDDVLAQQVLRWTVGDISDVRWSGVARLAAIGLSAMVLSFSLAHRLNLMSLGATGSQSLGYNPRLTLMLGLILAAVLSGVSVSVAGPIAFTGLIAPHIARRLIGGDHRELIPTTALCGAGMMLLADGFSKWLLAPLEAPIGVISALIGAPWFLWLTLKVRELE